MVEFPNASNIEGVLSSLEIIVAQARAGEHRWGLFAGLYREVTLGVAAGIRDGRFEDGERMSRFDAAFANRYFIALRQYLAGKQPTRSWRIALQASDRSDLTALQHLLLGVNAHINLDLGLAVVEAGLDPVAFRADFLEINRVLADVLPRAQSVLNGVSSAMRGLDLLLGGADEYLGLFVLERARDQAWLAAHLAHTIPEEHRATLEATLDAAAAHLAHRVADPGLPTSAAVALIRRAESWTLTELLDGFDGLHAS